MPAFTVPIHEDDPDGSSEGDPDRSSEGDPDRSSEQDPDWFSEDTPEWVPEFMAVFRNGCQQVKDQLDQLNIQIKSACDDIITSVKSEPAEVKEVAN